MRPKTIPSLSQAAAALLTDLHSELCAIIAAEVYRKRWARPFADDVIQDALTRTCAAVANGTAKQGPRSRARAAALDALLTLKRRLENDRKTFAIGGFDTPAPLSHCFDERVVRDWTMGFSH